MTMIRPIARIVTAAGLCLFAWGARAEVPANGQAYMDAAFTSVESLIKASQTLKPVLPRLADPVDGKVLADLWNVPAILGQAPYAASDISALLDIIQKQTRILQIYALFTPEPGRKEPDQAANAAEFQDELTRSRSFLLKAAGAALPAINDFAAKLQPEEKTDARIRGLREMRLGLQEIVVGSALALRSPGLRDANRLLLARGFAENAAGIATGLEQADRQALVSALQAAKSNLKPDAQKAIADTVAAFSAAPCEGLCKLD
jgi:hypothetical protein